MNDSLGMDFLLPKEYLKPAVLVSLLSVWILVALLLYLNRYTKKRYFSVWVAAWLFFALWQTLYLTANGTDGHPVFFALMQWCVGLSAAFFLWGSGLFLNQRIRQRLIALFIAFLFVWSYVGVYQIGNSVHAQIPVFILIGLVSMVTSWGFYRFRRAQNYIGAGLLAAGFFLWGGFLMAYPFLQSSPHLISSAFFISAILQLFIVAGTIVMVLEEVRSSGESTVKQLHRHQKKNAVLQSMISSTEERYRSLFEQASEAILITDAQGLRVLEMNKAAKRLLGVEGECAGALSLASFLKLTGCDKPPQTGAEWFECIQRRQQLQLEVRDGTLVPVEINGALIQLDGEPACQFFIRCLTDRVRLEQQLRQSEKLAALGQMISGIAHELNNPLAVIKGYLELILSKHNLTEQTRMDLKKIANESNRAAKLVNNFLAFARKQPARRQMVDVNQLIRRVVELREYDLRIAMVEVHYDLGPRALKTLADADQLQQVIINLVNNAMHALLDSPAMPRVLAIQSEAAGDMIRIAVEDNGPGVPEHLVSKIFEPFFTTKTVGTGTGLGLSIAHSIVSDHDGRLSCQRGASGGARFVLELPVRERHEERPAESGDGETSAAFQEEAATEPARILILDDEAFIADLLGEMMGLLGHKATCCNTASQALEWIARDEFDLVLSDFRMPQMDGRQFYEVVSERRPELARRIIFLTGDLVCEQTQSFLQSTGNVHLAKPFNLSSVEQAVAKVLKERQSRPIDRQTEPEDCFMVSA